MFKSKSGASRWVRKSTHSADIETLLTSILFDAEYYSAKAGVEFKFCEQAAEHFLYSETRLVNDPHPLFSMNYYAAQSPPLEGRTNALLHFISVGAGNLRQPHPLFDPVWYLSKNSAYVAACDNPLIHYLFYGWRLGCRVHPLFDDKWYRESYADVAAAGIDPFHHFVARGAAERRSPSAFFDTAWYLNRYPDVDAAGVNALLHYLIDGAVEGRNPSASFDTVWYLDTNPDVAAGALNPLVHYVEYGRAEGRRPAPERFLRLNHQFGAPAAEFDEWRHCVLAKRNSFTLPYGRRFQVSLDCGHKPTPNHIGRRVVVTISRSLSVGADSNTAAIRSAKAIAGAALQMGVELTMISGQEFWETAGENVAPNALALFIQKGDTIDAAGLEALLAVFSANVRLCVFDSYHTVERVTYPVLQPGANPQYLRSIDSTFSRFAIRGALLAPVLRDTGPQDERGILVEALEAIAVSGDWDAFVHCPFPVLETPNLQEDIKRMREDSIQNRSTAPNAATSIAASVSVIICTQNKGHLLDQLLRNLLQDCEPLITDVVIVSNKTTNAFADRTLHCWAKHPKIQVILYDKSFNFSDQCNIGAFASRGDFLLFLNDDIVPVTCNWLDELIAPFADPSVGVAGPLLLYPNETVQHAGMFLGFRGVAGHTLRHAALPESDYLFTATSSRDVSCVTGAALLTRRSCFEDLNGFDVQLQTIFQDVDLCLRVANLGYRIIYNPMATLIHMESISIRSLLDRSDVQEQRGREYRYFAARHDQTHVLRDPYLNPHQSTSDEMLQTLCY